MRSTIFSISGSKRSRARLIAHRDPDLAPHLWTEGLGRDDQLEPEGDDWTTWLLLGGRGAGKTRAGAEWIRMLAERAGEGPLKFAERIALVAETYADAREVMIEGPSGLRALSHPDVRPEYMASRRLLKWPNGAEARCFSAEDPDGLRGYQFDAAWADEVCKWRYPEETWSNLQLALRLGARPRQVVTTTPRPMALLKRLLASETTVTTRASSYANRDNLADAFFTEIASAYEGTALGRQELMGEIIDDVEGALWTWAMIEAARISAAPQLDRVIVAVDPAVTIGPDADECGIVVAGRAGDTAYVLADWSVRGLSPRAWAEKCVAAAHEFEADRIVVESNQGGEMARTLILQADPAAPVRPVHASKAKRVRAEPVAALYERGLVRHVGAFARLEDQMTSWIGEGRSPDRLDALVWAISELMNRKTNMAPGVRLLG